MQCHVVIGSPGSDSFKILLELLLVHGCDDCFCESGIISKRSTAIASSARFFTLQQLITFISHSTIIHILANNKGVGVNVSCSTIECDFGLLVLLRLGVYASHTDIEEGILFSPPEVPGIQEAVSIV